MLYYCCWKTGSTDKDTGARGLPQKCKEKKCTGEFSHFPLEMECFIDSVALEGKCSRLKNLDRDSVNEASILPLRWDADAQR
jgi:hypothetical protein